MKTKTDWKFIVTMMLFLSPFGALLLYGDSQERQDACPSYQITRGLDYIVIEPTDENGVLDFGLSGFVVDVFSSKNNVLIEGYYVPSGSKPLIWLDGESITVRVREDIVQPALGSSCERVFASNDVPQSQ